MLPQYAPIETFLNTLKGKYKIPLVIYLKHAPKRYHQIRKKFHVASERILIKQLKELENHGILEKKIIGVKPPLHVEYKLSKYGYTLCEVVKNMWDWGENHSKNKPSKKLNHHRM